MSLDTNEALLARIAVLEKEVRALRAALAVARAQAPGGVGGPARSEASATAVTADGTRGMTRGATGRSR